MTELRKADTLYDIDFDTLQKISGTETDATGKPIFYDIPTIARGLVRFKTEDEAFQEGITDGEEIRLRVANALKTYDEGVELGRINPDDYVYMYTNIAEKGTPSGRFMQFLLEGLTKGSATIAPGIAAGKTAYKAMPIKKAKPIAGLGGFIAGTIVGDQLAEKAVETGQSLGVFEDRPLYPQNRVFAKMGDVSGFNLATIASSPYLLPKKAYNTLSGTLLSESLLRNGGFFSYPGRGVRLLEKGIQTAGAQARGEKGKMAQGAFYGTEFAMGSGATVGAGLAEAYDPTDESTSAISQVGGGFIGAYTPSAIIMRLAPTFLRAAGKFTSGDVAESKAGLKLVKMIQEKSDGETVEQIIEDLQSNPEKLKLLASEILNDSSLAPILTPAQITGSPILGRFQEDAIKGMARAFPNSGAADEAANRAREGLEFAERLAFGLESSGNPSDMALAAEIRVQALSDLMESQFLAANMASIRAAEKIKPDGDNTSVISRNLYAQIKQINANAKRQEQALYDQVDTKIPITSIDNIADALVDIRERLLTRTGKLDSATENELRSVFSAYGMSYPSGEMLEDVSNLAKTYTFGELKNFRTSLLEKARNAMGGDNPSRVLAEAYGTLARAIDSEMDLSIRAAGGSEAYNKARAFSKARAESITKTFAGLPTLNSNNGAVLVRPELLIDELLSGNTLGPATLRIKDLLNAGSLVSRQIDELNIDPSLVVPRAGGVDDPELTGDFEQVFDAVPVSDLQTSIQEVVRLAAGKVLKQDASGNFKVDPKKANEFLQDPNNQDLLEMYPSIRTMVSEGRQLEQAAELAQTNANKTLFATVAKEQNALGAVIRDENPLSAISEAIESKNPSENISTLVKTIKEAFEDPTSSARLADQGITREDAMNGLKSSIIQSLWVRNGGTGEDTLNFAKTLESLFGPMAGGEPLGPTLAGTRVLARTAEDIEDFGRVARNRLSLSNLLQREGVFTAAELDRLKYILEAGKNVQVAQAGGKKALELIEEQGDVLNAVVRWLGAGTAGKLGEQVPFMRPQGLVEAGLGARLAGKLFDKVPKNLQIVLFQKAALDPDFMLTLLQKGKGIEQAKANIKRMRAYLAQAGLTSLEEDMDEDIQEYYQDAPFRVKRQTQASPYFEEFDDQVSMSSPQPPRVTTPAPLPATAPSVGTLAQAPSSPQTRNRMSAAFPTDGILGLMRQA